MMTPILHANLLQARALGSAMLAVCCAVVLWEIVLSTIHTKPPGYTNHPVLGRIRKPGEGVWGTEGFARAHFNSLGMRGGELGTKQPGERRVLFLGDSFTEALQVKDDETFVQLVGAQLGARQPTTVVNAGRGGASPASYVHLAPFYRKAVMADDVVIQLNSADFDEDLRNPSANFYVAQGAGGYETRFNTGFVSEHALLNRFPQLRPLVEFSVARVGLETLQRVVQGQGADGAAPPMPDSAPEPLISWTVQRLKAAYGSPIVLFVPRVDFLAPEAPAEASETALELAARSAGLRMINLRSDFLAHYRGSNEPATGFHNTRPGTGHLNAAGHRLAASRIAEALEQGR